MSSRKVTQEERDELSRVLSSPSGTRESFLRCQVFLQADGLGWNDVTLEPIIRKVLDMSPSSGEFSACEIETAKVELREILEEAAEGEELEVGLLWVRGIRRPQQ